ncbi:MAG: iron ABC transporter permease, partial [Burkholderiaceae bacterium]|nr:iron ABC transporter permease [Microbacteriaceae bacterium]
GIAIKASTDGENNLDSMSITFVYTVLLMIIMGLSMYFLYGRAGSSSARAQRRRALDLAKESAGG